MSGMSIWTVNSVALIGLWVFAVPAEADQAQVTGVATYSDRAMLPVDALLLVTLEDVSRAGAPAQVLATFELANPGAPPFPFVLSYDTDMIDQRFTYAVRARVTSGDSLLLISDTHTPIITNVATSDIEIMTRRVADLSDGDGGLHALPDLALPATYRGSVSRAE